MAELVLSKGYVALVDDEDFAWLSQWKWCAVVTGQNIKRVYVCRREQWDNAERRYRKAIYLHRAIMDAPQGLDIDHINGDTLDNHRLNLRIATRSQNLANSRRTKGIAGFRGVSIDYRDGGIYAHCQGYLGRFRTLEQAARAYDAAALAKFGEFATLNFP